MPRTLRTPCDQGVWNFHQHGSGHDGPARPVQPVGQDPVRWHRAETPVSRLL